MTPSAIALPLAIICALFCVPGAAGAMRALRRRDRDAAIAEAACILMAVAMAGMFEPRVNVIPAAVGAPLFTVAAAWSILRAAPWRPARRAGAPAHAVTHATMYAAMVYMYALGMPSGSMGSGGGSMAAMAMTGSTSIARPVATLALAMALTVTAVWRVTTTVTGLDVAHASSGPGAMSAAPGHHGRVDVVSAAAMGLVMAYALAASL